MSDIQEHTFTHSAPAKTTFYLAAGPHNGPLLIFIHGWPGISQFWLPQLRAFSAMGFRVVAPDMPGYGRSTARKVREDYCLEVINNGMAALLQHLGRSRAVWIGHDWGAAAVWSFASHYPDQCLAVAGLAVPYRTIECGLDHLLSTVDRRLYPEKHFRYGQWSYQKFYELDFDKATAWFDQDPELALKKIFVRASSRTYGLPAGTSRVVEDGGWFGGIERPDPKWRDIPMDKICLPESTFDDLVAAMKRNGFWGADAYYANHKRNEVYWTQLSKNDGRLDMPVLFIAAKWDSISDASNPAMCEQMRRYCTDLTETTIEAGHWVQEEKPQETTAAIVRWLVEKCPQQWPGYWQSPHVRNKL